MNQCKSGAGLSLSLAALAFLGCKAPSPGDGAAASATSFKASAAPPVTAVSASASASAAPSAPTCKEGSVLVPKGTYTRGDRGPTVKPAAVTIEAFCMDKTEVTTEAYAACVVSGKCTGADKGGFCNRDSSRTDHPINCVDWHQAKAYCEAREQRLPTEDEWEYGARGTDGRSFPWGSAKPTNQLCWSRKGVATCAVGSFPAGNSPFGLQDMAGNVLEWTSTEWAANSKIYINRGGHWELDDEWSIRSTYRTKNSASINYYNIGFRCAASL